MHSKTQHTAFVICNGNSNGTVKYALLKRKRFKRTTCTEWDHLL